MKKTIGYIYLITNTLNNKVYVGQHVFSLKCLDDSYFCSTTNPHFWNSIRKYENIDIKDDACLRNYSHKNFKNYLNFKRELIQFVYSKVALDIMETMWIRVYRKKLGKDNVYNLANGGQGWSYVHEINMLRYGNKAGVTRQHIEHMLATKEKLGILHDNSHLMTKEVIAKAMEVKRSKYGVGNTNCNSPEARAKATEKYIYLKEGIYYKRPKNYKNWKINGFIRICKYSEWNLYCQDNNISTTLK